MSESCFLTCWQHHRLFFRWGYIWKGIKACTCSSIYTDLHWFLQRSIICSIHEWCFICIAGHAKSVSVWASSQTRKHWLLNLNQRMFENQPLSQQRQTGWEGERGTTHTSCGNVWHQQSMQIIVRTHSHTSKKKIQRTLYKREGEEEEGKEENRWITGRENKKMYWEWAGKGLKEYFPTIQ